MGDPSHDVHRLYMKACLVLAQQAREAGYLGIGSLVVRKDQIIARAHERLPHVWDVTGHAELLAVRRACRRLNTSLLPGTTLYTTAEPCWMCAYAIRETAIETVVMGVSSPNIGAVNSRYPILVDATISGWGPPPQVISGVLEQACREVRDR